MTDNIGLSAATEQGARIGGKNFFYQLFRDTPFLPIILVDAAIFRTFSLSAVEDFRVDQIDRLILERLQLDGRISLSQLAKELRLSRPSVTERMRRLQEKGVVEGFTARISPAAIDKSILVLIQLRELRGEFQSFEEFVKADTEIIECHRVTGESCYMMKAAVSSLAQLEALINRLMPYGQVQTSIVLSSPVPHRVLLP